MHYDFTIGVAKMRGTLVGLVILASLTVHSYAHDSTAAMPENAAAGLDTTKPETSQVAEEPVVMQSSSKYTLLAGVQLGIAGGATATENAERRKVNPAFWVLPTYGAAITAPFGAESRIRGRLDLGVWQTGTRTRPYEFYDGKTNYEGYFVERYTYFTVAPYINLSGILIGMGFDFPMQGQMWNPNWDKEKHTIDVNTMKMAMDLRLGGSIPAWETDFGVLNVELIAYIMFSGVYEDGMYPYGRDALDGSGAVSTSQETLKQDQAKNLTPAGAHIGISYQFKIGL